MLRRIPTAMLQVGMYVHEFCGSRRHADWSRRFLIDSATQLQRVRQSGIEEVLIDTSRGADLPATATPDTPPTALPIEQEARRAQRICQSAREAVSEMLASVRMGKAVDVGRFESLFGDIRDSVGRHPHAIINLARLKTADDYTYMHSVAVCALMISLARQLRLDEAQVYEAGMAGLLHDLGKVAIPEPILNKPDRLSDEEFAIVRGHPEAGHQILSRDERIGAAVLDACLHHHEKLDGSGYPHRLQGEQISLLARMCAICDVYDAVTSERVYKNAWDPAEALHRMARWAGHFDPVVFQAFVKTIGIYPVGSLVRLSSGRIGMVVEQNPQSLLTPKVRVQRSEHAAPPLAEEILDLADAHLGERIVERNPEEGARLRDVWENLALLYAQE